jgi:hypothetical protein
MTEPQRLGEYHLPFCTVPTVEKLRKKVLFRGIATRRDL